MGSIKTNSFSPRIARFLNPVAKTLDQPPPMFKPTNRSNPVFKGWGNPPNQWAEWVNQMAGKHSSIWIKAGIFDPIMASIYEITFNHDIISSLLRFWNPKTNTFVFPWGEATVTLEDVVILGGYSVLGDSVSGSVLKADLREKIEVMNQFRTELVRSKSKKASHYKWIQMFMANEDDEQEHIGFLSLWLSRFVFPATNRDAVGKHVFPIAVRLSQGDKLDLATPILADIYNNLRILKEQCVESSSSCINLLGPFRLVQIWAYERLTIIAPKPANELQPAEPRLARWHGLNSNVSLLQLLAHMNNFETFIWRPYADDLKNWSRPLYYQDTEQILTDSLSLDDDLQTFARFLQPCKINWLNCKEKYLPHRVAMQFGYDQDIPGDVCSYKVRNCVKFVIPSRSFQPQVTKRYADWLKIVDFKDRVNYQDLSSGEEMNDSDENCDENSDPECVFLGKIDVEGKLDKMCSDDETENVAKDVSRGSKDCMDIDELIKLGLELEARISKLEEVFESLKAKDRNGVMLM
ncbi:serine/threonine-protein phosphatase 7 long form homolog [Rutidosis leptorrhynchoides]|uniref:serine/threonine-protein phosphatase 7 long form homolog n=1 Tax=Rutidosis leptorrhynchoides TaxID=125765 RepID=UPI003A9999EF